MSMEYCHDCDKMIDLDFDCEHECFEIEKHKETCDSENCPAWVIDTIHISKQDLKNA